MRLVEHRQLLDTSLVPAAVEAGLEEDLERRDRVASGSVKRSPKQATFALL